MLRPVPVNEADRLAALALYQVLDTPPEFAHDALTELAAQICNCPAATVKAVFESWEKSFGAASQGATALNHKIIEITERNIDTCFDLATSLAGAKSLSDAIELQAAYWRKQFGELSAQVEEVRALSTKVTANMAEPIRAQVTGI